MCCTLVAIAREEQPQVLYGRTGYAIIQINEMRTVVSPKHVSGMAVAVNPQRPELARSIDRVVDGINQLLGERLIAFNEMLGQPAMGEQEIC